jgi:hypothetical protein
MSVSVQFVFLFHICETGINTKCVFTMLKHFPWLNEIVKHYPVRDK